MTVERATATRWGIRAIVWSAAKLVRAMGIGALAGLVAGVVVGGLGGRLAMKAVALGAGPGARGMMTENGNRIGAFTADGTLFLLINGALVGLPGGFLYMALRPWLPRAGRRRGLAFGALLLGACGASVIEGENFDFHRFGVPALNVGLFAALFLLFGLLVAPVADYADRRFPAVPPRGAVRLGTIGAYLVLAGCALLGLLPVALAIVVGLLGRGEASTDFRVALVLFLALLAGSLLARLLPPHAGERGGAPADPWRHPRKRAAVAAVAAIAVLIGLGLLLRAIAAILTPV
jgi:hypothetical protein